MLLRRFLGYAPSRMVPAVVSVAQIAVFTRLLSSVEFGIYGLGLATHLLAFACFYGPLGGITTRYFPVTGGPTRRAVFTGTLLGVTGLVSLLVIIILAPLCLWLLPSPHATTFCLVAILTALRGISGVNIAMHQITDHVARFGVIECTYTILNFVLPLLLFQFFPPESSLLFTGMICSALICCLIDLPFYRLIRRAQVRRLRPLLGFAVGVSVSTLAASVLLLSDRVILGLFGSSADLGQYQVATSLMSQPVSITATILAASMVPTTIRLFETAGSKVARIQAGRNILLTLAMIVPICVGTVMVGTQIVHLLVGAAFREGVVKMLPWIAAITLLRTLSTHCLESIFVLAHRPDLIAKLALPVIFVGLPIAAYGAARIGMFCLLGSLIAMQTCLAIAQIVALRLIFPLTYPLRDMSKIFACSAIMAFAVSLYPFKTLGVANLLGMITTGIVVYVAMLWLMNAFQIREGFPRGEFMV